jgi:hypothetical protein
MVSTARNLVLLQVAILLATGPIARADEPAPAPAPAPAANPAPATPPGQTNSDPGATLSSLKEKLGDNGGGKPYFGPIEDPEVDCKTKFSDAEVKKAEQGLGRKLQTNKCLSQQDSLTRATEASSYLAYYLTDKSNFAIKFQKDPEFHKKTSDAFQNCIMGSGQQCTEDNQAFLVSLIVNYNLIREARAQYLINNTNAENLKTMEARDEKGIVRSGIVDSRYATEKTVRQFGSALTQSFMLDPVKVAHSANFDNRTAAAEEREILGPQFIGDYKAFIDAYTRANAPAPDRRNWHYVATKVAAVSGDGTWVIQNGRDGKPMVDEARERLDERLINKPMAQQAIKWSKSTEAELKDITGKDGRLDPSFRDKLHYQRIGLGTPEVDLDLKTLTPAEVAEEVVVSTNTQIHNLELKGKGQMDAQEAMKAQANAQQAQFRALSSAGTGRTPPATAKETKTSYVSVKVDDAQLRNFLDTIWPVTGQRPVQDNTQPAPVAPPAPTTPPPTL